MKWLRSWTPDATEELTERPADLLHKGTIKTWLDYVDNLPSADEMTNPFNREQFLFYMLAGIFVWQGVIFSAAVIACFRLGGIDACPELGRRWENTSGLMVATTLALLGTSVAANRKPNQETKDDVPKLPPNKRQ